MNYQEAVTKANMREPGGPERWFMCIDLKSFYASVECVERGLDPMTTDLVVADPDRSDRTICLAVSPSLKKQGVGGRPRVFEIPKHLTYIMAPPRMGLYVEYAARIYDVYLDYISPDDMHVYSIDEVFFDVTHYLDLYGYTPREMAVFLMNEVYERIGVRATAGIGTNMYLAKIALDITAKHSPDFIGYLDQQSYIETLWDHKPLRDFWMIGPGISRRLEKIGIQTMRGLAKADEELLYKMFGVNAELMIDHAWGVETTEMSDIKGYKRKSNSLTQGQVLMRDYSFAEAEIIVKEMIDQLSLELSRQKKVTKSVALAVGYSNAYTKAKLASEDGPVTYSKMLVHGSASFNTPTNSCTLITAALVKEYRRIVNPNIPVRRIFIFFNDLHLEDEDRQLTLFDLAETEQKAEGMYQGKQRSENLRNPHTASQAEKERDAALQNAVNAIKQKYGKDAMFKGMDLEEAATTRERNHQIGGHKE